MANAFKKTAHSKARHVTFQESFPTSKQTHFGHRLLPPLPRRSRHRPMTVRPTATSPSCFGAASRSERQGRMTTPDWRRLLRLRRLAAARLRKAGVRRRSREFCPKQRKASMGNGLWLEGKQAGGRSRSESRALAIPIRVRPVRVFWADTDIFHFFIVDNQCRHFRITTVKKR